MTSSTDGGISGVVWRSSSAGGEGVFDDDSGASVTIGRPKSATTTYLTVPGVDGQGVITTNVVAPNTVRYNVIRVLATCTVDRVAAEVTAGPASNAHIRLALYRADFDCQPTGGPVIDSEVAVSSGSTGVITADQANVVLAPGLYLPAINVDVQMSLRALQGGAILGGLDPSLGATASIMRFTAAQSYGAMPTPGTAWTSAVTNATAQLHVVFFRLVTP